VKILIILLLISFSSFAQVYSLPLACPPCPTCKTAACPEPVEELSSATSRDKSFGTVMGGFQFINTWVPNKITGSYTQILNRDFSLELEYATSKRDVQIAGFDAGELKEERYTFLVKYYVGTSFHIGLGPYIAKLSLQLDDHITDAAGNKINDKAEISLIGITFNIGNRWQFDNGFTLGVDWLRMNQPTGTYQVSKRIFEDVDEDQQENVDRTNKFFKTTPTFTLLGLSVGYSF
jgi:hypothetical protein